MTDISTRRERVGLARHARLLLDNDVDLDVLPELTDAELPVLLLITTRPVGESRWAHYPHGTTLSLGRLTRRQSEDLVASVAGERPLPRSVIDEVVAKADGIPLYIEELTKSVLESGAMPREPASTEGPGATHAFAIPSSLHGSLMAHLDRLESVKEVAQIGAVIGRECSYPLREAVCEFDGAALQDSLSQRVDSQLVFQRGEPPDATYQWRGRGDAVRCPLRALGGQPHPQ